MIRDLLRPALRAWRRAIHRARGGRGVRIAAAPDWIVAAAPGGYEELRYWLRYEAGTFAALRWVWRPGIRVLDIGAHHGEFSLCCLPLGRPGARILAVEPSAAARRLLRRNLGAHREAEWAIAEIAAGEGEGTVRLQPGAVEMLTVGGGAGEGVTVPLTTADKLCGSRQFWPEIVKIDVEGYELETLRGARAVLQRRPWVFLEWHCDLLRQRGVEPKTALEPLLAAGYEFRNCAEFGPGAPPRPMPPPPGERDILRLLCSPPRPETA